MTTSAKWLSILLAAFSMLMAMVGCKPETPPSKAAQSGAQISPIRPPATSTNEPTPPSNDWPTLTPWPTLKPEPTRSGTPVIKATPTSSPTRPPLLLTPMPVGIPPSDLQALYYGADNNGTPELHVVGIDKQSRKWSESSVAHDLPPGDLAGLHSSPDGKYLAVDVVYGEQSVIRLVERSSGHAWCPFNDPGRCTGWFGGWTHDNQLLFHPFNVQPGDVILGGTLVVNTDTGKYIQLDLPASPDRVYALAQNVSIAPDSSRLAYSITRSDDKEISSEIWTMRIDGQDKRLVHRVNGVINVLSWSPVGEQLIYLYQPNGKTASSDASELWLLSSDGRDERLLTNDIRMAGESRYRPTWSPDGRYVAFVQVDNPALFLGDWREPGTNLFVVGTSTGQITRLSSFKDRNVAFPTWSPDGKFVAFVSSVITGKPIEGAVPQYAEVWVASTDGHQLYTVSDTVQWRSALAWLPSMSFVQEK